MSSSPDLTTVLCVLEQGTLLVTQGHDFEPRPDHCVVYLSKAFTRNPKVMSSSPDLTTVLCVLEQGTLLVTQRS